MQLRTVMYPEMEYSYYIHIHIYIYRAHTLKTDLGGYHVYMWVLHGCTVVHVA